MKFVKSILAVTALASSGSFVALAQNAPAGARTAAAVRTGNNNGPNESSADPGYRLGPGDQVVVRALNVEEITNQPIPVDLSGYIRLPIAGRVKAAGLTVAELETEIGTRLKTYVLHPDVTVSMSDFRSQPVSVIGAVKTPGQQQVQGRKTLLEMLSAAGGMDAAVAGNTVTITRRLEHGKIPLPNATDDPSGQFSVAQVNIKSIQEGRTPQDNILIEPEDVISVSRADTIYVIGQVQKPGAIILSDHDKVTVLEAFAYAGGQTNVAKIRDAELIHKTGDATEMKRTPINLDKIREGKDANVVMQPNDMLYIPDNVPKKAGIRALEAAIQAGTGIVIWRRP
jgi:polysaccharide export outer membrane protein